MPLGRNGLDLPGVADHGQLLLVPAAFGEHAQVEGGPDPVVVLDDDEGVVEDVGRRVIALVEMVDVLAPEARTRVGRPGGHQGQQVEEVAALLDERAAGVPVEPVSSRRPWRGRGTGARDGDHVHPPTVPDATSSRRAATGGM